MARSPSPRNEASRRHPDGREPWLEAADPQADEPSHTLIGKRTLIVLGGGLLLLAGIVAAGVWLISEKADAPIDVPVGEIPVVASPGPWKVPAEGPEADGVPVEGQGQLLFPAGEGQDPPARIDPERLPEEPLPPVAEKAPGPPTDLLDFETTDWPVREERLPGDPPLPSRTPERPAPRPEPRADPTPAPDKAPPPAVAASSTIQLGAFSTEARARAHWKDLSARFPYVAELSVAVAPVASEGRTLYRLRASGPGAAEACNRLKIAGETCAPAR
ncbi:MAG: SPOR domain-containing protein [Sphingomonadaceae bacterium]